MSSVTSTDSVNPGLASLIQNISQTVSPLVSSPKILSALKTASPSDFAQLSAAALQLQNINGLFGSGEANSTDPNSSLFSNDLFSNSLPANDLPANNDSTLLANVQQSLAGSSSTGSYTPQSGIDSSLVQSVYGHSVNLLG